VLCAPARSRIDHEHARIKPPSKKRVPVSISHITTAADHVAPAG
jgi:hypothetical protein